MGFTSVRQGEVIITDANAIHFIDPKVDGETKKCGTIPQPAGYASRHIQTFRDVNIPLIPENEWKGLVEHKVETASQISDVWKRQGVPILDQNGRGYCWAHSGASAVQALRALANLPTVGLSAYHPACIIKSYRDEGGWGAQGLDFISEKGIASEAFWPMKSVSRSNDKPEMWANALLHRVTEGWVETEKAQYDRNLTRAQVASLLLANVPVVVDYNWWGHSVCAVDLVVLPNGQFGVRIANSWGTSWSDGGFGVLDQSKAWPNGSVAPRASVASIV